MLDVGLGRPLEILGASPGLPAQSLPPWVPHSVALAIDRAPSGTYAYPAAPPYGRIVLWVRHDVLGREVQVYQEFPESFEFYLRVCRGNETDARRLRAVMTEFNRDMRYFVEERHFSPEVARAELRAINEALFRSLMEATAEVYGAAADATALIDSLGRRANQILEAAQRGSKFPRGRPSHTGGGKPPSGSGGGSGSSGGAPRTGSTSSTPPPKRGEASATRAPQSGETSSTRPLRTEPQGPVDVEHPPIKIENPPPKAKPMSPATRPRRKPNRRHDPCKTRGKDRTKAENTMIDPDYGDAVDADIKAIQDGQVAKQGETWAVNGRTYQEHDGSIFPTGGEGTVQFSRGQHQFVKMLNTVPLEMAMQFATKLARSMPKVLNQEAIDAVLEVWKKCR